MQDNVAGTLAYVLGFITGIIFLVLEPYNRNRVVRFHAFQAIYFSGGLFAIHIALMILSSLFMVIPGMGFLMSGLFGIVSLLVSLGGLVLWIVLLVKTYGGSKMVLPIIGPLAEKQA
jgi:uncharacterized membrane protein